MPYQLELSITYVDAALGRRYGKLTAHNISSQSCNVQGFPGFGARGEWGHNFLLIAEQVDAVSYTEDQPRIELKPGDSAYANMEWTGITDEVMYVHEAHNGKIYYTGADEHLKRYDTATEKTDSFGLTGVSALKVTPDEQQLALARYDSSEIAELAVCDINCTNPQNLAETLLVHVAAPGE